MSCYHDRHRDMLVLKCDGCGKTVDLYEGETDRCLCHDYIHKHGWKTQKKNGRWINICDECVVAVQSAKRERFVNNEAQL